MVLNAHQGLGCVVRWRHITIYSGLIFTRVCLSKRRGKCNSVGLGEHNKVDVWDEEQGHFLHAAEYFNIAVNYLLIVLDTH